MKPLIMFYLMMAMTGFSHAQTIAVVSENHRIKGSNAPGYSLELTGSMADAESSLPKFLKNFGKTRTNVDYTSVSNPFLGGITYEGKTLYATLKGNEKKCEVWIGMDTTEWRGEDIARILEKVKKVVYQFGVRFYFDLVQKEIDESQQAFDATEKQKARLVNQNKDLNIRLSNNEQERLHLQKSLENNELERMVIFQKLENNKKEQDSVANAGLQIKKVLDAQKEKQKRIN